MKPKRSSFFTLASVASVASLVAVSSASAANVTLSASDAFNFSSFASGLNWSDSTTPSTTNDYFVTAGRTLRTDPTVSSPFAGNSLTLGDGTSAGILSLKNSNNATVTIANLTLSNGEILNAGDNAGNNTTITLAGGVTLTSGTTNRFNAANANRAIIVTALISGGGALAINGGVPVTLSGNNSYTGGTTVQNGTLVLSGGDDRLAATSSAVLGAGTSSGKLVLGNATTAVNQTLAGLTTAGTGTNNRVVGAHAANSTLTLNIASTNTFAGTLGGTGTNENNLALTKSGVGTLIISSDSNSFTGAVTVNLGELQALATNAVGAKTTLGTGAITVNSGATLRFKTGSISNARSIANNITLNGATFISDDGVATYGGTFALSGNNTFDVRWKDKNATLSNTISGTGSLTLKSSGNGGGMLTLSGANTYTGGTTISEGTLQINDGGSLAGGVTLGSAVLQYNRSTATTVNNQLNLGGSSGNTLRIKSIGAGAITYAGNTAAGFSSTRTLSLGGASVADNSFSGIIANSSGGGTIHLTKEDAGKWILSGTNTYTGNTTVSGGKLVVDGSISTSILTTVNNGASLGGSGSVGALTVNTGGTLTPGNSPGNLTIAGNLTLAGTFAWELGALTTSGAGTNFDTLTLTSGNANLAGSTLSLSLGSFAPSADSFWQTDQTWTDILNNTGAGSLTGMFGAIDNSAWASLGTFTTVVDGNDVNLVWTAVPEPGAALLGSLGVLALLRRRRTL